MKMSFKVILATVLVLTSSLLEECSSFTVDEVSNNPSVENSLESDFSQGRPRQLSLLTNPFRRAANTTRNVVKFIRDYSTARFTNQSTPQPQTAAGARATALLQHVTLNNIRRAVTTLLQSEAAPVVGNILTNLDRDTLQLFTSADRTPPSIIAQFTKSTTARPRRVSVTPTSGGKGNTTDSASASNSTTTTTSKTPTTTAIGIDIKSAVVIPPPSTANTSGGGKVTVSGGDDDEEENDSNEDDNK